MNWKFVYCKSKIRFRPHSKAVTNLIYARDLPSFVYLFDWDYSNFDVLCESLDDVNFFLELPDIHKKIRTVFVPIGYMFDSKIFSIPSVLFYENSAQILQGINYLIKSEQNRQQSLVPLLFPAKHDPDLMEGKYELLDAVFLLKKYDSNENGSSNFKNWSQDFCRSENIKQIYVDEYIEYAYRNLIQACHGKNNYAELFLRLIEDGENLEIHDNTSL